METTGGFCRGAGTIAPGRVCVIPVGKEGDDGWVLPWGMDDSAG